MECGGDYNYLNADTRRTVQNLVLVAGLLLLICLFVFAVDIQFNGRLYTIINKDISPALIHACIACSMAIWINLAKLSRWLQICILLVAIWTLQHASSDAAALGVLLGSAALVMHKNLPRFLRAMFIYGMPLVWIFFPFVFRILTPETTTNGLRLWKIAIPTVCLFVILLPTTFLNVFGQDLVLEAHALRILG